MARTTHEREDLLRDARALTPRVQLRWPAGGAEAIVVAGFRGAALSLYFGDDLAFHFNEQGQLRRAFVDDRLIKAVGGKLVAMRRIRTASEVVLQSEPLSDADERRFLDGVACRLAELSAAVAAGTAMVDGQVPPEGDAVQRLTAWLADNPRPTPAASPRVG